MGNNGRDARRLPGASSRGRRRPSHPGAYGLESARGEAGTKVKPKRCLGRCQTAQWSGIVHNIFWLIGVVVVVLAVLGFLGLR